MLARWLRPSDQETADRLDRAIDRGGALLAISRQEAGAILIVVAAMTNEEPDVTERLENLVTVFRDYVTPE